MGFLMGVANPAFSNDTLVEAVIWVESRNNQTATSQKGAVGLMQLTPIAVREVNRLNLVGREVLFEEVRLDSKVNVEVGAAFLYHLIKKFNSVELGLAAYNAGEGRVVKAGYKIPNIKETQNYVRNVLELWESLKENNE